MGQRGSPVRDGELAQFQHTQLGVYLAGAFGLCYVWCSSAQGIVDHYHFSKKWFYLYGVLVAFAYLYMRPFVRRGLGSAHRGYLNFYSLYILWLCSALFCHLPSLEALGIDIKADISVALSIAASSLLVLGVLHGLQVMLIHFKILTPAPGATQQAIWSCILLNSITLAAACSTYFQLCGNGAAGPSSSSNSSQWSGMSAVMHDAVCVKYLAPIPTKEYPTFSAWMLYGERNGSTAVTKAAAAEAISKRSSCSARRPSSSSGSWFSFGTNDGGGSSSSSSGSSSGSWFGFGGNSVSCEPPSPAATANISGSLVDFVAGLPAGLVDDGGSVISPVFTMWITLVTLYLINVLVDHVSAYDMSARHISELRRERVNDPNISLLAKAAQAAGETFRQGAHHLVAAQQQRHQLHQQHQPQQDELMSSEGDTSCRRSISLEIPSPARKPWSPRFMAERTLVNFLESTSSLSFAAAALLEGMETKGFPWQQLQNQARLGSLAGGLSTLGDRLGSIRSTTGSAWGQGWRDIRQQRQHSCDTSRLRRASTDGGEGVLREQQQKQRRQRRQQHRAESGVVESDDGGVIVPGRLKHTRSKSLSSIQSAGTASGREEEEVVTDHGSKQQQQRGSRSRRGSVDHQQQQDSWQTAQHRQQQQPAVDNGCGHPDLSARTSSKKRRGSSSRLAQGQIANTELQSDHHQQQQQQQRTTRASDRSSGGVYPCTSPFAAASQPGGLGFGSYSGFGSAVSLHSHSSEGHETRALEQVRAAGAQVDGAAVAGRFEVRGYSSDSSGGGDRPNAAAPVPETGNGAVAQQPGQSDAAAAAQAQQAPPGDAVVPESGAPSVQADSPVPLPQSATSSSPTEASGWSDDSFSDMAECDGLSTPGSSYGGPSPPFLDMVPWYSGTSADLFKTMFDLMISLKLFLGRFDMRTMQAATAASMADSFNDTPSEGDGFTYEHYHNKEELWFDFIADTGDGGNSTYTVARALAAPSLTVPAADVVKLRQQQEQEQQKRQGLTVDTGAAQGQQSTSKFATQQQQHQLQLPRGEVLLIGGDLAYPNPNRDTYEQRLFAPFQEAMPPPPHYHPGRLCVHKPDLPPAFGLQESLSASRLAPSGLSPRTSRNASVAALRGYSGPNVFAIPGNHDWIDGLETFIKHIMHKGWLGGWLMPQEKSYFSLRLPDGWWVFGLDLALVGDIDMCQYRYFANVVERRLGPADNVIIITHEPIWLLEWFWASSSSSNLRQLVRGHLRGRARVHLAGDLHFYMRHSYTTKKQQKQQQGPPGTADADTEAAATAAPVDASATTAGVAAAEEKVAVADYLLQMPSVSPQEGLSSAVTWETPLPTPQGNESTVPASQPGDNIDHKAIDSVGTDPVAAAAKSLSNGGGTACSVDLGIRSRRSSSSSSSSSGVDSCTTPPGWQPQQQTEAAAAAAPSPFSSSNTSRSSSPGIASLTGARNKASNGSPGGPGAARCPIDRARQTLPRLVVGSPVSRNGSGDLGHGPSNSNRYVGYPQRLTTDLGTRQQVQSGSSTTIPWPTSNHDSSKHHNRSTVLKPQIQQHQEASLLDPEHLIVNGCGGAFLHPTHVFSYSRFACLDDEAAAATAAIYSSADGGGFGDSYLTSVPISSGSSSSSSLAAAGHSRHPAGTSLYSRPSVRQSSLSPWDPDMLSWHCPMSPSGMSDIWDQQSLPSMPQLNLGPAAVAAGRGTSQQQQQHDPLPMLGSSSQPMPAAAATATEHQKSHATHVTAGAGPAAAPGVVPPSTAVVGSGVYKCAAAFPSAEKSVRLGRKNLHLFRFKNSRFDVIGGAIYFLSIVSTLPRCNAGLALLSASSLLDFMTAFAAEFRGTWYEILMDSYLSLFTVVMFCLLCFGFAKGGGVGAVSGERQNLHREQKRQRQLAQQQRHQDGHNSVVKGVSGVRGFKKCGRRSPVVGPLVKLRTGGGTTQLLVAVVHAGIHLSLGVVLLLVLELGVELCIKYEHLGTAGVHSMYFWFEQYQDQHFPDPMGLRDMAHRWSLGLYPGVIKAAMAVYDIPEAIAVARNAVCSAESVAAGFGSLSRVQLLAYYAGMLAYYWLLAIPAMGFVFGLYLYVCVCWFHVHYDEAFSALRIANFKGLTRLHVTKEGDLEIFTLGIDRVPTQWREDPRWYEDDGAGGGKVAAYAAAYPSRWMPAAAGKGAGSQDSPDDPSMGLRVVDYLKVPRQRPGLNAM